MEKDIPYKHYGKEGGVPIVIPDEVEFRMRKIIKNKNENIYNDKKVNFLRRLDDNTNFKSNWRVSKYMRPKLIELKKKKKDKFKTTVRDFIISLSVIEKLVDKNQYGYIRPEKHYWPARLNWHLHRILHSKGE